MLIDFENPVYEVDEFSQRAFVEILNLVLLSDNVEQLSRHLRIRDRGREYRRLSGYFKWSYADYSFTLWQRLEFGSPYCFRHKILEIKHISMISENRSHPCAVKN